MSLTINEFPEGSGPEGIVSGLDCNLWFTENGSSFAGYNKVGQINPTTHAIAESPNPQPALLVHHSALNADAVLVTARAFGSSRGRSLRYA